MLDGQEVAKTERLKALQKFMDIKAKIIKQQVMYKSKRVRTISCDPAACLVPSPDCSRWKQKEAQKQENLCKISQISGDAARSSEWEKIPYSPEYRQEASIKRQKQLTETGDNRVK